MTIIRDLISSSQMQRLPLLTDDAISATTIELPFKHNGSTLKYNEETGTYDYYEYGSAHKDADSNAQLTSRTLFCRIPLLQNWVKAT